MADDKNPAKEAAVHLKNLGIRHRVFHPKHGPHVFEPEQTCIVPASFAHELLADNPGHFEVVKMEGGDVGEFNGSVKAALKSRKEAVDARAKIIKQEQKEAEEIEKTAAAETRSN